MTKTKIDLSIIKRLLAELEATVATAEGIDTDINADKIEYIVEMSKASGLAASVMTESAMLMGELQSNIASVAAPGTPKSDFLDKILGGLKGPGSQN